MRKEEAVEQMEPALDLIGKVLDRIIMVQVYPKQITQCTKMDRRTQTAKIINKAISTVVLPRAIPVHLTMRSKMVGNIIHPEKTIQV